MIGLRLTDGVITLDLQAGFYSVIHFTPHSAARSAETVNETIDLEVKGTVYGQATVRDIQQLITNAKIRDEEGMGRRVFLEFNLGTSGDGYWRSEIIDGRVSLPDNDYHYDMLSDYLAFTITLTRLNYWEEVNESVATLLSNFGTGGTQTNFDIFGHHRAADFRQNLLRAFDIKGDIPTPVHFSLFNNYSTGSPGDIFIGHMLEKYNTQLLHVIEGESSTLHSSSTLVTSAVNSGGQFYQISSTGATEIVAWSGALSQTMLESMDSNEFNVMVRMPSAASAADVIIRASLVTNDGLFERWSGRETLAPTIGGWLTLGRVRLPPRYLTDTPTPAPLRLRLNTQRLAGGAYTLPVDYVMFLPTYGFRKYRRHSYGIDPGITLHDKPGEGPTGLLYTENWGEGKYDNYVAEGDPIMIVPDRINLLTFAFTNVDTVLRKLNVQINYRTRRLTV